MAKYLFTPAPNEAAVRFLKDKSLVAKTVFDGLVPELRGLAFTITGIENLNVMKRARDIIAKLPAGADWESTRKTLAAELCPWLGDGAEKRAETLLRVHGFSAQAAAQYQVMDRQHDVFPFWQYQSAEDERVRETHAALDGKIFPADSSFWNTHYPPWELNCRCSVVGLTKEDVDEIEAEDTKAKRPPEARRVVSGANLASAENNGVLYSVAEGGVPRQLDVRSPREKFGGSGFYHNPGDLHLDLDALKARYATTPEVWKTFEAWAGNTKLGKGRGSVMDWLQRKLPTATPADGWPDLGKLVEVRKLGGSTGAVLVRAPDGREFVMKRGNSPAHVQEEVTADELYRSLGANVPACKLYTGPDGKPVKLAEFVQGETLQAALAKATPAQQAALLAEARKHFVGDALLGNYDVAGLSLDNMLVDSTGKVWRIDNGGSLRFRAQGAMKPSFGGKVSEIETLRDPAINAAAARVFGGLSEPELRDQLAEVVSKRATVLAVTPPELREALKERFDDLDTRLASLRGEFTPEFAAKVNEARILGKAHLGDADKVEDLQVLWYQEKRNGQDCTIARFKLTSVGGEAVREAHKELLSAKPPPDPYWEKILPVIKHVGFHAKDGAYNDAKTAAPLAVLKAQLTKATAAERAHYAEIIKELESAMAEKRAPKMLGAYLPPPPKSAENGDLTLSASPWTYSLKTRNRGFAEDAGQKIYEVKNAIGGTHAGTGAQIHAVLPDDKDTPYALRGTVEIAVPGRTGLDAIKAAAEAAKALGVDVAPATPARRELTYLARNLSVLHKTMGEADRKEWQTIVADEKTGETDRATRLRGWVKNKLGIDVGDGRAYSPDGAENAFGNGWKRWERWDMPRTEIEKEMKGYTLHHKFSSDMVNVLDSFLNGGGEVTPTVERLRLGVPITDGMSPDSDLATGGASYFFTRIKKTAESEKTPGITFKIGNLARLDAYSFRSDVFGDVRPVGENSHDINPPLDRGINASEWKAFSKVTSNETNFKNGFHLLDDMESIITLTGAQRTQVLATFAKHGYEELPDGRKIADVVRVKK
ncbi:phage minor head protein [Geminisphaera colitermitum]|uniref:phage head morphogenesis protein n=1 Tax=Geminisphaera colitermitum TaxID=1148786 RepID=UPI000158D3F0|nr:phage minor head protein [Geminisphaera colitermitum]